MLLEKHVDLVLLDMDGTLLDLHYDAYFWLELVPSQYALLHNIADHEASVYFERQCQKVSGTLPWYCYDHWSKVLGLDIHQLQHQCKDKIRWREDTIWFLKRLKKLNKKIVILTNAHPSSIELKNQQTKLLSFVDLVISSHDVGYAKESPLFWSAVKKQLNTDFSRSLFIDDSEKILSAAQLAGIPYLIGINKPDSKKPAKLMQAFSSITLFKEAF